MYPIPATPLRSTCASTRLKLTEGASKEVAIGIKVTV